MVGQVQDPLLSGLSLGDVLNQRLVDTLTLNVEHRQGDFRLERGAIGTSCIPLETVGAVFQDQVEYFPSAFLRRQAIGLSRC